MPFVKPLGASAEINFSNFSAAYGIYVLPQRIRHSACLPEVSALPRGNSLQNYSSLRFKSLNAEEPPVHCVQSISLR